MANWVTIKETKYAGSGKGTTAPTIRLKVDTDSITPTQAKFKFFFVKGSQIDGYYILYRPGTASEQLLVLHKYNSGGSKGTEYEAEGFTLTKNEYDTLFVIPEYWICNCGSVTPLNYSIGNIQIHYDSHGTKTMYWYFTNSRSHYVTKVSSFNCTNTSTIKVPTGVSVTKDNIHITPNLNNTFKVEVYFWSGTNNKILSSKNNESTSLWWRINGYSNHEHISETIINNANNGSTGYVSKTITVVPGSNANGTWPDTWPISGGIKLQSEYEEDVDPGWKDATIKLYVEPEPPTKLELTYSKGRLTVKENWVIKWSGAKKRNNNSPIKGYRVRVYRIRDGVEETVPIPGGAQDDAMGEDRYYLDTESTAESLVFDPTDNFIAGDKVKIGIYAYTKNGYNDKKFSGGGITQVVTSQYPVENAGIMRVKVDNSWLEGQVYVKVNNTWQEAESVQVKTSSGWEESE